MSTRTGLLGNITIDLCGKAGGRPDALLKNAALLYDNVFFHNSLWGDIQGFSYSHAEILASWAEKEVGDQKKLAKKHHFTDIFISAKELSTFSSFSPYSDNFHRILSENIKCNLKKSTKKIIAEAYGLAPEDVENGKLGNTWEVIPAHVAQEYLLLSHILKEKSDIVGLFSAFHSAICDFDENKTSRNAAIFNESLNFDFQFPDFGLLSWGEVFELRDDPAIVSLRNRVFGAGDVKSGPIHVNREGLRESYIIDLEKFYNLRKPDPHASLIKGFLGNIPTGIPNPFSFLFSAVDIKNDVRDYKKFSWLHFVQQVGDITTKM